MTRKPAPAILLALTLAACRTTGPAIPVEGVVAGQRVRTTVDSEIARYYVEEFIRGAGSDSPTAELLDRLRDPSGKGKIDRAELREIARNHSADLAALLFIERLLESGRNRRAQESYLAHLEALRRQPRAQWLVRKARGFEILFAPGWFYRSDPESGADFRAQRELLDRLGIANALVETGENASVETNADLLATALRDRRGSGRHVILVSTSKSGPEAALALGDRLRPEETAHVRAWVNVGGILRGTPLADAALRVPGRLVATFALRGRLAGIASLRTRPRRARFETLRMPAGILVVNYVAVPFSGGVTPGARSRYRRLVRHGPNDGLTLLADVIAPGGVTVVEPGLDHFFAAPDILERGLAVLAMVFSELRAKEKAPLPRGFFSTPVDFFYAENDLPAAAPTRRVRVGDGEPGAAEVLDVIHRRVLQVRLALGVHDDRDPALLEDQVVVALLVEGEPVLEARATATWMKTRRGLFWESGIVWAKYFTLSIALSVRVSRGRPAHRNGRE